MAPHRRQSPVTLPVPTRAAVAIDRPGPSEKSGPGLDRDPLRVHILRQTDVTSPVALERLGIESVLQQCLDVVLVAPDPAGHPVGGEGEVDDALRRGDLRRFDDSGRDRLLAERG